MNRIGKRNSIQGAPWYVCFLLFVALPPAFGQTTRWPTIALLHNVDGTCRGTTISPYHVLTAAHCVKGYEQLEIEIDGQTYGWSRVRIHPDYGPIDDFDSDDIAVVTLDRRADGVTVLPLGRDPQSGEGVYIVDEDGPRAYAITRVGNLIWSEDAQSRKSGSPTVRAKQGYGQLLGIHKGSIRFTSTRYAVRVDRFLPWIDEEVRAAPHCCKNADINGDGHIDIFDLVSVSARYRDVVPSTDPANINCDGTLSILDLASVAASYGAASRFYCSR